ncbi:MAG: alpha/beta hydrolase [Clostridiales bacterium]|nr:alpha/beta hydrolase [Clostridiales bacterium]
MNTITTEWDKCYPKNEKVNHKKVSFKNHFGIELVADYFSPKGVSGKLPAIACCGAFGAVKEQHSGLYAQEMASRGFITIAFDPSFTGESDGEPRYMNSPDINVEDFQAAVDYLSNLEEVDSEKVSIIGICGWGGMALQTACIDTRIKATVAITMYDMSRVSGCGYYDSEDSEEARYQKRVNLNNQRTIDFKNGSYKLAGGTIPLDLVKDMDVPVFVKDYSEYYRGRAYHNRSLNSNNGWNVTASSSLMNTRLFTYAGEIRNAVLLVHGEKAHSLYFGQDAFKLLKGDNKEFLLVKDATHCDLYDGGVNHDKIPFDKIEAFIKKNI